MSDQFIGEIRLFALKFAPYGWALCNGQLLAVRQYTPLFSVIGITYGGDGVQTFALPNLQGRIMVGTGQGPGLSPYALGEADGATVISLSREQSASHIHGFNADREAATTASPEGAVLSKGHYKSSTGATGAVACYTTLAPDTNMSSNALGPTGAGLPHDNMMPYLALNYCIALTGEFPPRS